MGRLTRLLTVLTLLCLLLTGGISAKADGGSAQTCQEQLLQYYCYYQSQASREIEDCLRSLEAEDPAQGKLWRRIMTDWARLNETAFASTLPDGLPDDDSLCIVVFGFGLNENGSMKPELLDRLRVARDAARQYPNAFVAVTGGETSEVSGISEAGEMAAWLRNNGVADSRLIVEDRALSTTENAQKTYGILIREYPQVRQAAVVTSDYHVSWAAVLLQTVSTYESMVHGTREIPVTAVAACATEMPERNTFPSQAWGIGIITGTNWNGSRPELIYAPAEPEAAQAEMPETEPEVVQAEIPEPETVQTQKSLTGRLFGWLFGR